jgi:hypothetical protein
MSEGRCFGGLYRSFRALVLIQFGASHLARRSRRVHRRPARNIPYRCESCSQTRMVGYRCGKRESEAFSVLMLQPWRTHNDPMLCGSHPVKTLFSRIFFLMATEPSRKTLLLRQVARFESSFHRRNKPAIGQHIASASERYRFAHYRKQLCYAPKFLVRAFVLYSRIGKILREPRDWLLNCVSQDCGLQASEPSAPKDGNLWGFPDQPSSPHHAPHVQILRWNITA